MEAEYVYFFFDLIMYSAIIGIVLGAVLAFRK